MQLWKVLTRKCIHDQSNKRTSQGTQLSLYTLSEWLQSVCCHSSAAIGSLSQLYAESLTIRQHSPPPKKKWYEIIFSKWPLLLWKVYILGRLLRCRLAVGYHYYGSAVSYFGSVVPAIQGHIRNVVIYCNIRYPQWLWLFWSAQWPNTTATDCTITRSYNLLCGRPVVSSLFCGSPALAFAT